MNSPGNATAGESRPATPRGGRAAAAASGLVERLAGIPQTRAALLARARARLASGELDRPATLRDTAERFLRRHQRGE
ncbi:MAG: hypothetical protein AB7I19_06910 [Planctomycetota bacterium]